jgi:starch phosphorylase
MYPPGLPWRTLGWSGWVQVTAVAYDNPIPGFKTRNCINLRLWAAKPSREFDLEAFNTGDYVQVSSC